MIEKIEDINLFTKCIFESIKSAKTIEEIKLLIKEIDINFDFKKYPKLDFEIKPVEIELLKQKRILNSRGSLNIIDGKLTNELSSYLKDPLLKLLFAMAWKQGDLLKLDHIINGISNFEKVDDDYERALVFYQFGKHLANKESEPIIDQNVLKAFSTYLGIKVTKKNQQNIAVMYKKWIKELKINHKDYLYYIDILLFVTGKVIKESMRKI